MCGISGIYTHQVTEQHQALLDDIIKSQLSRGPDHQASTAIKTNNGEVLLGHNRLSIIDISAQGNQPMWDASGRYCIVFNGEIYNYLEIREELRRADFVFHNHTDTEVILNAFAQWGINALQRFRGPFAFALYDKHSEKLWLARDRFGVRPLFYIIKQNTLYFASSSQVLAKTLNLRPNFDYVARGLQSLVYEDGSQQSPWEELHALPAGTYMQAGFSANKQLNRSITPYYDLAQNVEDLMASLPINHVDALLPMLQEKFENAVTIRLRTDVPLAISLSGGLDSSSIASAVRRQHHNTIGFSFSHPDHLQTEGPDVAACAKYLDIQMQYVWPNAEEIMDSLNHTIAAQDAPFSTFSIVAQYLLYKQVRAAGVKVLLGGQGGDEAFMGYKKFLLFWLKNMVKEGRYFSAFKHTLQMLPMMYAEAASLKNYWHHRHRYFGKNKAPSTQLNLPTSPGISLQQTHKKLWQRQLQDITQFSLPTLLRYEDRNAMAHSVESRLPYLDHELVEFGLALPVAIKLRSGYGKWIVREMMENKIPDRIRLARYKRGFDIPMHRFMEKGLGNTIRSQLQASKVIDPFLPRNKNINELFSNQQFLQRPKTMSEAITLLWLDKALS